MLALISLQNSYIDLGIRQISACCRARDIPTSVLWLNREPLDLLSDTQVDAVIRWLKDTGCIAAGMNVMSAHLALARHLTQAIQLHLDIPVIWGGVHCILEPEECLQYADFVCVGEGEHTIVPLMTALRSGQIPDDLRNFWYFLNGSICKNPRDIVHDLDSLPIPDNSLKDHWVLIHSAVEPVTQETLRKGFPWNAGRHIIMSGRGCPYRCTFCCSDAMKRLFGSSWANRFRSVDHFMREIQEVLNCYPFVHTIAIMDDTFFFKPDGWIEAFCSAFRQTGAQFGILLHPKKVSHDNIAMLIDAGLIGIQMGLQSGSERISRGVFNRVETIDDFKKAAAILDAFTDRLQARTYDVIVDNPFETDEERMETIRVLMNLKKPFNIDLFSLTLYPGTRLYDQYRESGLEILSSLLCENKNFLHYEPTPLNRLIRLTHSNPSRIIDFLLRSYNKPFGKRLIVAYDRCWENGLRVLLRKIKRAILPLIGFCRSPLHSGN